MEIFSDHSDDDFSGDDELDEYAKTLDDITFKEEPPFPNLPKVESFRDKRIMTLAQWMEMDELAEGGFPWPEQSEFEAPIVLPTLVQFTLSCPYQTESERGTPLVCVLLAVYNDVPYFLFYEGCHLLNHTANVGDDGNIYPWSSVNGAGKAMHGSNANAIDRFILLDKQSPYVGKSFKALCDGPGFENTLDYNLLEAWSKIGKTNCTRKAIYQTDLVKEMMDMLYEPKQQPSAEPKGQKSPNKGLKRGPKVQTAKEVVKVVQKKRKSPPPPLSIATAPTKVVVKKRKSPPPLPLPAAPTKKHKEPPTFEVVEQVKLATAAVLPSACTNLASLTRDLTDEQLEFMNQLLQASNFLAKIN